MLKIRKRIIALALAGTLALVGGGCAKRDNTNQSKVNETIQTIEVENNSVEESEIIDDTIQVIEGEVVEESTPSIEDEIEIIDSDDMITQGDYVTTTDNVNIRFGNSTDYYKLDTIDEGTTLYRILSNDGWDLVRYNDYIGYVSHDYVEETDRQEDEVEHEEIHDILETTDDINFRYAPSTDGEKNTVIEDGTYLEAFAKTDNNWYLVKYNGTYGYVSGDYVTSISEELQKQYPDARIDEAITLACVASDTNIYGSQNSNDEVVGNADSYDLVRVLEKGDDYSLVLTDDTLGYVENSKLQIMEGVFVTVDLGEQSLVLYSNSDPLLNTPVTTGKDSTPTNVGLFQIKSKTNGCYLTGADYKTWVDYWMPFDGGIGLHDASWRSSFGGEIYHTSGSHGCVNIPSDKAGEIYNDVEVGTKVLVYNK